MKQRGREGEGEREGELRSLMEACLRAVAVVGRKNLNIKIAAFHIIHPLNLPSGLERSEGDTVNNRKRGVNPSHHCQLSHFRATASLLTLLLNFPHSLFCGLYLTGGLQVRYITRLTPPHPSELYPQRCLWGG